MPKEDRFLSRRYSSNFVFHPWGDMPAREPQLPPNTISLSQLWSPFKILSRTAGCIGYIHPSKFPDGQRWKGWTIARIQVGHAFSSINTLGSISYMSPQVSRLMKVQYFYKGAAGQDQCCAIRAFPCSWFPAATADVTDTGTALGCLLFLFCSLKKKKKGKKPWGRSINILRKTSAHLTYSLTRHWRLATLTCLGTMMKGKQHQS